jgi:hypothetical protein
LKFCPIIPFALHGNGPSSATVDKLHHYGATITGYELVESYNEPTLVLVGASHSVIVYAGTNSNIFE